MNLRQSLYRLKKKLDLQFIRHSWLDFKRDKAKAAFGISGIAISLFLLTTIGMLNDTVSYNYLLYVTSTTGSADIMITKTIKTDLTFDPFYDEDIINDDLENIEGVEELFPRIMMLVTAASEKSDVNGTFEFYGIDFDKEAENGIESYDVFQEPFSEYKEKVYYHEMKENKNKCVKCAVISDEAEAPFGLYLTYNKMELPQFVQWKMLENQYYVLEGSIPNT